MPAGSRPLVITGLGITTAIGQGREAFASALLAGRTQFDVLRRPGRSWTDESGDAVFIGAEIDALRPASGIDARHSRTASWSSRVAVATCEEAWQSARLADVPGRRVGLVVGGSNLQERERVLHAIASQGRERYTRPTHASSFLDTDVCGLVSEIFGIRGLAHCVAAASASGQLAVIEAAHAVDAGRVDACVALGGLMDISYLECQAMRSAGAMGTDRHLQAPAKACRPFDAATDGFIYGEGCAAVVIETEEAAARRGATVLASLAGWGVVLDGSRGTQPSVDGEMAAIHAALDHAGIDAGAIDYVNPHGTGSVLGDVTEADAIVRSGLAHAWINTTKSVTGHGLTAAGAIEIVATLIQMHEGRLHPSVNLVNPIRDEPIWVGTDGATARISCALNLSMGFGGINTALCLRPPDTRNW